jgi:hypothetical protein
LDFDVSYQTRQITVYTADTPYQSPSSPNKAALKNTSQILTPNTPPISNKNTPESDLQKLHLPILAVSS